MVSGRATAAAERPQAGSNNSAGMMVDSAWPAALASKLVAGQQQQGATTAMPTKTGLTPRRYLRALHAVITSLAKHERALPAPHLDLQSHSCSRSAATATATHMQHRVRAA